MGGDPVSEEGKRNRRGRGRRTRVEGGEERAPDARLSAHVRGLIAVRQEGACTLIDATESLVTTPAGKAPWLDSLKNRNIRLLWSYLLARSCTGGIYLRVKEAHTEARQKPPIMGR